jgi:hypothetical protein
VLGAVLVAWGFLVGFDAFRAFVGEVNDVGTGQYTLSKAVACSAWVRSRPAAS